MSVRAYRLLIGVLAAGVVVSMLLGTMIGAVAVLPGDVWAVTRDHLFGAAGSPAYTPVEDHIIWQFRLPRALLAAVIGAGLAIVGTVMQALVRNPLADPYLLGVSSGASFGAVMVLALGSSAVAGLSLSAAAFLGGLVALGLVYAIAQRGGQVTPGRLILAGVALAYLFQAGYSFVIQKSSTGFDGGAQQVLYWLLGSLGGARWSTIGLPSAVVLVGLAVLLVQYRPLNALLAGDETATSLGVNLARFRLMLFLLTSVLVGVMVASSGAIAFVGLILPHIARLIVGSDHRRVLPVATLLGAIFLQLVDIVARTADQPTELPLTIVTAFVGVPFFVWLLRRRHNSDTLVPA